MATPFQTLAPFTFKVGDSRATVTNLTRASILTIGPDSPQNRDIGLRDFQGLDSIGNIVGALINPQVIVNWANVAPAAASATYYVNAQAVAGAGNVATIAQNKSPDVPRTLQYVSSNAGDTTQTVIVTGQDQYLATMTEKVTLNGVTVVHGQKAFWAISTVAVSAALAGNLSVGTDNGLGLPVALDIGGFMPGTSAKNVSGTVSTDAGTVAYAARTLPALNTSGDVRGTYTPAAAPNGTNKYFLQIAPTIGYTGKADSTYGVLQSIV